MRAASFIASKGTTALLVVKRSCKASTEDQLMISFSVSPSLLNLGHLTKEVRLPTGKGKNSL